MGSKFVLVSLHELLQSDYCERLKISDFFLNSYFVSAAILTSNFPSMLRMKTESLP